MTKFYIPRNRVRQIYLLLSLQAMVNSHITNSSGADPGFPIGGGANHPEGGGNIRICKFFQKKLHEIEKISCRRGAPGAPPPKSSNGHESEKSVVIVLCIVDFY